MISLSHVSKFYGRQDLLSDVSLAIHPGERIALVGINGAGKTTLFSILLGTLEPDAGQVHRKKGLQIGYLPQEVIELRGKTVLQQVMDVDSNTQQVMAELNQLGRELEQVKDPEVSQKLADRQSHLLLEIERLGGYDLEPRAKQVLAGLGFREERLSAQVETLSGGWIMRVALARLLLSQPDLLLLDEPTNHLDLESLIWLENYLANTSSALLLISHDRAFLDRVVSKTLELERGRLTAFQGNYSYYLQEKEKRREIQAAAYDNQQEKIRQMEDFIARNRSRKDRASQVQSRIKALENMERILPPTAEERKIAFQFSEPERSGKMVLELTGISKSFGRIHLYRNLNLAIDRGDRIAFLGPNGAGKSTLLKIMAGMIAPDGGKRQIGHKVTMSYFAQHQLDQLDSSHTVWQEASSVGGDRTYGALRNLLAAFLFREDEIEKKVSVLSGGEKSRLVILKMLLSGANFLLLDEPTNHLDIPSRDVLEEALQAFNGTLCLITHDRHLINSLANKILYLRDGKPEVFPGNYRDFEEIWRPRLERGPEMVSPQFEIDEPAALKGTPRKSQEEKRQEAERRNALFKRQAPLRKEIEALEQRLAGVVKEKEKLEKHLADPETYKEGSNISLMMQDYNAMEKEVAELTASWEAAVMKLEALEEE
ncbi:MAG TPA: ABC-F family ATP-binding cassette domain-containing protein [Thermodesulfobacteriota bacterium]|nr:ABC-F family ATP-binding cassette domain-containing protein [Thermodesulfobacteriota bacterium]